MIVQEDIKDHAKGQLVILMGAIHEACNLIKEASDNVDDVIVNIQMVPLGGTPHVYRIRVSVLFKDIQDVYEASNHINMNYFDDEHASIVIRDTFKGMALRIIDGLKKYPRIG